MHMYLTNNTNNVIIIIYFLLISSYEGSMNVLSPYYRLLCKSNAMQEAEKIY